MPRAATTSSQTASALIEMLAGRECRGSSLLFPAGWKPEYAVVIPAKDEESQIRPCLEALDPGHPDPRVDLVCLVVNNSTDRTFAKAADWLTRRGLPHVCVDVDFAAAEATVGAARRLGLDIAANFLGPEGVLMTTDADCRVGPGWQEHNLAALRRTDVVCGEILPDASEASRLGWRFRRFAEAEREYVRLTVELHALLDPLEHDPFPAHGDAGGASLAFHKAVYEDVGMPALACGEDRAFVARAEDRGWRISRPSTVHVSASCRLVGRAPGGMADTLALRQSGVDLHCDDRLDNADTTVLRAWARGKLRRAGGSRAVIDLVLDRVGLRPSEHRIYGSFREVWRDIEARSPLLLRRRMTIQEVKSELPALRRAVELVRAGSVLEKASDTMTLPAVAGNPIQAELAVA